MTVIILIAIAFLLTRPVLPPPSKAKTLTLTILAILILSFVLGAVSVVIFGPWQFDILGISISASRVAKHLSPAFTLLIISLFFTQLMKSAFLKRSVWGFYVGAAGICYLLSFGPTIRFLGMPIWEHAPYSKLMLLPGFNSLRVPTRIIMVACLCLSIAAGLAFNRLRHLSQWSNPLTACVIAGILLDSWVAHMPLATLPPPAVRLPEASRMIPVLELPVGIILPDCYALYHSMSHQHPLINGYSGYDPPHYSVLRYGVRRRDPTILRALAELAPMYVIINKSFDLHGDYDRFVSGYSGIQRLDATEYQTLYFMPPGRPFADIVTGSPLAILKTNTNIHQDMLTRLTDNNRDTIWTSEKPQDGHEEVLIDFGTIKTVESLRLSLGPRPTDFPRKLVIDASPDRNTWKKIWTGTTAGAAFAAAMKDQIHIPLTIQFPPENARYLRLKQVGHDSLCPWSISELQAFAPR